MTASERRALRDEARAFFATRRNDPGTRLMLRLLDAAEEDARDTLVNAADMRELYQAQGRALLAASLHEAVGGRGGGRLSSTEHKEIF